MKKKLFILLGMIFIIVCGGVGYYFYLMSVQEDMLKHEVINYTNKDLYKDDYIIDIKTKGDYAYIEESIKKYYKELSDNVKVIQNYLIDEDLQNVMIPSNLNEDRPTYKNSYKIIDDAKKDINDSKNRIIEMCSEEYIKNLVSDRIHDEHYMKLYNDLMYTDKDVEELKGVKVDMEELSSNFSLFLDKLRKMINILEKYNDKWVFEDNSIFISDRDILDQYNREYRELKNILDNKLSKYKNRPIGKSNYNSVVDA